MVLETTLNLLFPPRCLLCGSADSLHRNHLCARCHPLLDEELSVPACPTCAASVGPYEVDSKRRCRRCRGRRPNVLGLVCVGAYHQALGHALRLYKYQGHEPWAPLFGAWLTESVKTAEWIQRIDVIVPVPTHWRHRLGRPLYPPHAMTRHLQTALGKPTLRLLRRIRAGPHQIGLAFAERAANVRGAFAISPGVKLRDAIILLVDDVRTTGATLEECARTLRRNGAAEVYGAVLLRAGDDRPPLSPRQST